jgi:hypothetical protein
MPICCFVWKRENIYIRQTKTWNMDKYKVVIVDDDDVALENLSFELLCLSSVIVNAFLKVYTPI